MTLNNSFDLVFERELPEIKTLARFYRHKKTGAQLLSLINDDVNKVFGITFRTPPEDSTGLPHIMEHSVLCGSRKYPVKEPFVELMKGSLNTFLNAMTFPDKTTYPVASQNLQDFYNLVDVYLDAVFYPLITPYTLQQEGWHYHLENPGDEVAYKGVVFNEMKGYYSTPDAVLTEKSQHTLFPDTIYANDCGGEPDAIPALTYQQFKAFHDRFYHPSNALIFFSGDDDPEQRLSILDEYLSDFEPQDAESQIALQPALTEPRRLVMPYDASQDESAPKALLTVNWLLPEVGGPEEMFAFSILNTILTGTPASPLRKALFDSSLGEDLTGRGLEMSSRQMFYSTGLKGVAPGNVDQVEALIFSTLEQIVRDGIESEMVAAALNTEEFRLRENNTGSFPRGLGLMLRALNTWLYDKDPLALLAFEAPLNAIKARLEAGERYFEDLIQKHLLDNPHRSTVILEPDPQLGERRDAAERERLDLAWSAMTEAEREMLVDSTRELQLRQSAPDSPEALATIPMLRREDLDREVKRVPVEVIREGEQKILYHDLFTNGIFYLDVGFNLQELPAEWLPYIPLFGQALLEMGTETEDYVRLSQHIGRTTGGIWPAWFTSAVRGEEGAAAAYLFLRGKATVPQAGELLKILTDVIGNVRWDNRERFRQIVLEQRASLETSLVNSGHRAVLSRIRSRFNQADFAAEQISGASSLFALRRVAEKVDRDWPSVREILEQMQRLLLTRQNLLLNVTLDGENWQEVRPLLPAFFESIPAAQGDDRSPTPGKWELPAGPEAEGLAIPSQVNYVGKGADLYQLGYQLHGSVLVIVPYLRSSWLWEKVRVQGGAYGGFCVFDQHSGVFAYVSYRDPNLASTLDVYDQTGQYLKQLELDEAELTKAIIGAIGDLDAYQLPDAQGYSSMLRYLIGMTDEERQRLRDQVLGANQDDFRAFGEALDRMKESGRVAVLGSEEALAAAQKERFPAMEMVKVL